MQPELLVLEMRYSVMVKSGFALRYLIEEGDFFPQKLLILCKINK